MTKEEIGKILKNLRISCGMTQKDIASKIGRTQQIVGHWETGYAQPDANTLFKLCEVYGTTVDEAFGFTKSKKVITPEESEHLKKYRSLDLYGQETVDIVIERELNRIELYGKLGDRKIITLAEYEPTKPPTYLIPYWEEGASAGNGIYQLNDTESIMMTLWASELTKQADFIIKVSGDSMEPDFYDGDKVLVDRKVRVEKGDVGIFWKDGNTYIKEMGENELISRNPKRANIPTDDFNRVICMGKVIGKLTDEMIAFD